MRGNKKAGEKSSAFFTEFFEGAGIRCILRG
ncbi:hypothetical protein FUAX_27440 [Fulvitalea axinellae]|uniref:Uncharacterized protein n=1 Tax=Fulvitalea axinellae TaxID=1182444 RepID=A0AAU9CXU8_9BACT|nr:hypothetical protein FUAX_27440 [Fulvitalea axinellae]